MLSVALIGDYDPHITAHQAIPRALSLAADYGGVSVEPRWLSTEAIIDTDRLFVATLFQPERVALEGMLPPLVAAFVRAAEAS